MMSGSRMPLLLQLLTPRGLSITLGQCSGTLDLKNKVGALFDIASPLANRILVETPNRPVFSQDQRKAFLDSLTFERIDARLDNIEDAHGRTCNWLHQQQEYQDWLNEDKRSEHHGFLWMKGKPGAGKSTIMKHCVNSKVMLKSASVISFFFNARGGILEKSVLGMYRSLLFQVLKVIPRMQDKFLSECLGKQEIEGVYNWSIEEIQSILHKVVKMLENNHLVCFIDALDECEESEVQEMVEFLETLAETAFTHHKSLHIFLSSRHYPHISINNGIHLIVENQSGHEKDIEAYVRRKLQAPKT
jgi:hypothetical protein